LAGYTPDPIYGDKQQKFNIYRPDTLETSGYCHPILVWSNGHTDNPEQNPPDCVVSSSANKWCGQYLPVVQHLASHGFVVIASLSTTTSKSDAKTGLLPSIMGLEWLLEQAEDSTSAYYHRLDTAHIGAFGHSEGGMATCMLAKDPRFSAISTVSGTSTITAIHAPAVFFCGGKETNFDPPMCDSNMKVASTITTQPAMLINAVDEDHGSWAYDGASGVAISGFAAWFRLHLMGDTAQRKRFYGDGCTFCTDNRVKVLYRNDLMSTP
jgi:dienelactone hydrolase